MQWNGKWNHISRSERNTLLLTKQSCRHFFPLTDLSFVSPSVTHKWRLFITSEDSDMVKISTKFTLLGSFKISCILKSKVLYCRKSSVPHFGGKKKAKKDFIFMQDKPWEAISLQLKSIFSFFFFSANSPSDYPHRWVKNPKILLFFMFGICGTEGWYWQDRCCVIFWWSVRHIWSAKLCTT